jgi:hypothetical protein
VTLVSGSVRGGGAASLAGADGVYYLVRSPFFGNPSWYGTFATDANAADFKATFSGLTSRTCTLNLAIYRWPTGTWVAMGSPATINTYVTTVSDAAPSTSLPASELRSASGEVRVRATCSAPASFSQWTLSSDLLRLSYVS